MSDGEQTGKGTVLLKAEVPESVAKELDRLAKELNFSTRAGLMRHIVLEFIKGPKTTPISDFERMDPGLGFRGRPAQDFDMSELVATLHTLNKALDVTTAQTNIMACQAETIHSLTAQNEQLTQALPVTPRRPALPEPSQEQTHTRPEVIHTDTDPVQTGTEPIQDGDMLEVSQAVELGTSMGVKYGKDTVRRAIKEGILVATTGRPIKIHLEDVRAFALEYAKVGEIPKVPKIRDGKAV